MGEFGEEIPADAAEFSVDRGVTEKQSKATSFEAALEGLRKRPPTELAMRDGQVLLQTAILDQQAQQQGEPDTKEIERLRRLDTALAELAANGANELTYEQAEQLRKHFKKEKGKWDKIAKGSSTSKDTRTIAFANRDVFTAILADVKNNLPTMESILPEYPTYSLARTEPLLSILPGRFGKIEMSDVVRLYDAFTTDIASEKSREENAHPDWVEQKKAIKDASVQQAIDSWNGKRAEERKPILVTIKADGKIEATEVDPQTKISTKTADDRARFTVDPEEDMEYLAGINEFDLLDHLAKLGVTGLTKLQVPSPVITSEELDGMRLFIQRLEEGIKSGVIKNNYRRTLKRFKNFMQEQFEKAQRISDPEPQLS